MTNKPDLLEYVYAKYLEELDRQESELTDEAKQMFESFIEFCRFQLRRNPAISLCMLDQGIGLKLADADEVALVKMPDLDRPFSGAMPVTNPPMHPAANSITDIRSVPIFGGDQKK